MLINYSAIDGLPAVDVTKGSKVGDVRSFSVTFDGSIKGLLIEHFNGGVILVEPSHVLGVGRAAAVIDLDEQHVTSVSTEHIEDCMIIGRPVISLLGNSAGKLVDCAVDVESMEIRYVRLQIPDQEGEINIPSEQIRTLGRQFIILKNDVEAIVSTPKQALSLASQEVSDSEEATIKDLPVALTLEDSPANLFVSLNSDVEAIVCPPNETLSLASQEASDPEESPVKDLPVALTLEDSPSDLLVPGDSEQKTELSFMNLMRSLGSQFDRIAKQDLSEPEDQAEAEEEAEKTPLFIDLADWEDQIEALVDKRVGRTLAVDHGETRKTFDVGTMITREMAEELAIEMPLSLELLSLFVK